MSELAADVLAALSTPDEVESRLGRLEFTDGPPSASTVEIECDGLELLPRLDGRAGTTPTLERA